MHHRIGIGEAALERLVQLQAPERLLSHGIEEPQPVDPDRHGAGLVTEADHAAWSAADLRPYVDHVVASFGWERLMFGSDWPVARLASTYPRWVEALDAALAGASGRELRLVYRDNAEAYYRLNATKP